MTKMWWKKAAIESKGNWREAIRSESFPTNLICGAKGVFFSR
jgi:hypothetical protein